MSEHLAFLKTFSYFRLAKKKKLKNSSMTLSEKDNLNILNQIFEIRKKLKDNPAERSISRNLQRISTALEDIGYKTHNPINETYDETRLDCEARIAGETADNLYISEVIKPIIYLHDNGQNHIVQKAIVIAEEK